MSTVILEVKCQIRTGDTVTGTPMTNPAVMAIDTSIAVADRRRTAEILSLTEERRQKISKEID
jgi:hypothetical protein